MTRRLAIVITSVVLATLLLSGVGTLVVDNVRSRQTTRIELRRQAETVAANLTELLGNDVAADDPAVVRRRFTWLRVFRETLDLDGLAVFTLRPNDTFAGDEPPAGFDPLWLSPQRLRAGDAQDGNRRDLVYAAAPVSLPDGRVLVVVLTDSANSGLAAAAKTFLVAALATLAIGIAAALVLGRRLTAPVRQASAAARSIARGELSTRLAEPTGSRHDELSELARSVNSMATELQRSRLLEQQFLLSISHDLRTPLTSIRGFAEAINDGVADPQQSALVIRSETRRLERLVADLLDLAKLRSSGFSLQHELVDVEALAAVACDAFRPDAADRRVTLRMIRPASPGLHADPHRVEPPVPQTIVSADHDRLAQVAANLIENALKFARTEVDVAVAFDERWVALIVDDDGPGIAAEDLAHVFERLYVARMKPARHESSSGLGLAIVNELVSAMGGRCSASRAPIGGARIEITLPRHIIR